MAEEEMNGTRGKDGEEEKSRRYLSDNREGKRPPGRTMSKWGDNVSMVLKGIRWDTVY
jgi:hypothetical protein